MGDIPFEPETFHLGFLPSKLHKARRDGIHLFGIRYWSDALAGLVGRGDGKVAARRVCSIVSALYGGHYWAWYGASNEAALNG
ncbi:Mu transposase C-terminal domain-containing protein [Phaeovulum sp.]|uniref:Mu transposase C-terminal domain-containing protein n=1 Tax=Phaeovulum sp. TaxID=2934796 RepID=UPI0039E4CD27